MQKQKKEHKVLDSVTIFRNKLKRLRKKIEKEDIDITEDLDYHLRINLSHLFLSIQKDTKESKLTPEQIGVISDAIDKIIEITHSGDLRKDIEENRKERKEEEKRVRKEDERKAEEKRVRKAREEQERKAREQREKEERERIERERRVREEEKVRKAEEEIKSKEKEIDFKLSKSEKNKLYDYITTDARDRFNYYSRNSPTNNFVKRINDKLGEINKLINDLEPDIEQLNNLINSIENSFYETIESTIYLLYRDLKEARSKLDISKDTLDLNTVNKIERDLKKFKAFEEEKQELLFASKAAYKAIMEAVGINAPNKYYLECLMKTGSDIVVPAIENLMRVLQQECIDALVKIGTPRAVRSLRGALVHRWNMDPLWGNLIRERTAKALLELYPRYFSDKNYKFAEIKTEIHKDKLNEKIINNITAKCKKENAVIGTDFNLSVEDKKHIIILVSLAEKKLEKEKEGLRQDWKEYYEKAIGAIKVHMKDLEKNLRMSQTITLMFGTDLEQLLKFISSDKNNKLGNLEQTSQIYVRRAKVLRDSYWKKWKNEEYKKIIVNIAGVRDILSDFTKALERNKKRIPPSIENCIDEFNSWLEELTLPLFLKPEISNDESPEKIQQKYEDSLKEYEDKLKEKIEKIEVSDLLKRGEKNIVKDYPDKVSMLWDPFDHKDKSNASMARFIKHYNERVIPKVLDKLGFEYVPDTIGITSLSQELHEIKDLRESKYPPNRVIEVLERGFRFKGAIKAIRTAKVIGSLHQ